MKKTILTTAFGLVCALAYGQTDDDQDVLLARKAMKTSMLEPEKKKSVSENDPNTSKKEVLKPEQNPQPVYASLSAKPAASVHSPKIGSDAENKNKLKLAFYVNGDRALTSRGIFKSDQQIELKAFTFVNKQPLVITEMNVDLIRDGKKINSTRLASSGNLDPLMAFAMPGDQFTITVKEVYETTPEGHLRSYAKGNLYLNIPFVN